MPSRILRHRREGSGADAIYRMLVHVDTSKVVPVDPENPNSEHVPDPASLREFTWGAVPVVPPHADLEASQAAYAGVHKRPLALGKAFVTEAEYVALQIYEALEVVAEELREKQPKKLSGEGLEF